MRKIGASWTAIPAPKFFAADLPAWHVPRSRLHALLKPSESVSLTAVVGPPGSGKTQLIREWLVAQECAWVWLSIDEHDNDVEALLALLIAALQQIQPGWGVEASDMLDEPSADSSAVLRSLLVDVAHDVVPAVVVLDDLHRLTRSEVHQLFEEFIGGLPATLHVVVASRADPPVRMGRMRAAGTLGEVRLADLRFEHEEAASLLQKAGVHLSPANIDALVRRTEGWATGLRLAALALADGADPSVFVVGFDGTDRNVAELLFDEVLSRQPDDIRSFLLETSVLDELDGGICDHLTGRNDSTDLLQQLHSRQLFLIPLDRVGRRFRYHHLFADFLRFQLRVTRPLIEHQLHSRVIEFFEREGDVAAAIDQAVAAGDLERAFALLVKHSDMTMTQRLEAPRVRRWLAVVPDAFISANAERAAQYGLLLGGAGLLDDALRWAARAGELAAESADDVRSRIMMIRALGAGAKGDFDTFEDLRLQSLALTGPMTRAVVDDRISIWRVRLLALAGRVSEARQALDALRASNPVTLVAYALDMVDAQVSLFEGDVRRCQYFADRAISAWQRDADQLDFAIAGAFHARAWVHLQNGELDQAEQLLEQGLRLLEGVSETVLYFTFCVLEFARLSCERGRFQEAEQRLESHLYARDGVAGTLFESHVEELRARIRDGLAEAPAVGLTQPGALPFGQILSPREVTVLSLLATHLQGREIARQLFVSTNTFKTHTKAIYRKLGTTSRSETVAAAKALGLIP